MAQQTSQPTAATTANDYGFRWTDLQNIAAGDGQYVLCQVNDASNADTLQATDCSFAIPGNATINGVEISAQVGTDGPTVDWYFKPNVAGANEIFAGTWGGSTTSMIAGGSNELFGATITPADVNGATFGAAIRPDASASYPAECRVDTASVTVYYTVPAGGGSHAGIAILLTGAG
jgi:hypothetical protein